MYFPCDIYRLTCLNIVLIVGCKTICADLKDQCESYIKYSIDKVLEKRLTMHKFFYATIISNVDASTFL